VTETQLGPAGMDKRTLIVTMIFGVVLSVVFSVVSLLLVVCLIPLQWVYYKAGPRAALLSGLVAMVVIPLLGVLEIWVRLRPVTQA